VQPGRDRRGENVSLPDRVGCNRGIHLRPFSLAWLVGSGQTGKNSRRLERVGSAQASQDFWKMGSMDRVIVLRRERRRRSRGGGVGGNRGPKRGLSAESCEVGRSVAVPATIVCCSMKLFHQKFRDAPRLHGSLQREASVSVSGTPLVRNITARLWRGSPVVAGENWATTQTTNDSSLPTPVRILTYFEDIPRKSFAPDIVVKMKL